MFNWMLNMPLRNTLLWYTRCDMNLNCTFIWNRIQWDSFNQLLLMCCGIFLFFEWANSLGTFFRNPFRWWMLIPSPRSRYKTKLFSFSETGTCRYYFLATLRKLQSIVDVFQRIFRKTLPFYVYCNIKKWPSIVWPFFNILHDAVKKRFCSKHWKATPSFCFTVIVWATEAAIQRCSLGKGVLKMCSKFTGEHLRRSVISIKLHKQLYWNHTWHGCSPVNLLHILRTPFPMNTSGRLLLEQVSFFFHGFYKIWFSTILS